MNCGIPWVRLQTPVSCGTENVSTELHPGTGWRLPSSGSLYPVMALNFVLITQAFCTNSNWREMLAVRQMK